MKRQWGLWIIGDDFGRGDPAGHWYRITPSSDHRVFSSQAKAKRHKAFVEGVYANHDMKTTCTVEPYEDAQTTPDRVPPSTRRGLESNTPGNNEDGGKESVRPSNQGTVGPEVLDNGPKTWSKDMFN